MGPGSSVTEEVGGFGLQDKDWSRRMAFGAERTGSRDAGVSWACGDKDSHGLPGWYVGNFRKAWGVTSVQKS